MRAIYQKDAEDAIWAVFDLIKWELNKVDWQHKGMVINDMENTLTRYLKVKMERAEAKKKVKELVEVLLENEHAESTVRNN
jgi:hypothetical protein